MCPSEIQQLENKVMDLYTLLGAQVNNAGVKFGGDLPAGFQITDASGEAFVPSPFGMESILDCAQRVYESWEQSGKQPGIPDLLSWFGSMGAVQEERISTLLLVVTMTALRLSIASGESSTVLRILRNIRLPEELKDTAQSTSSRNKEVSGNGESSATPRPGKNASSRRRSTPKTGRKMKKAPRKQEKQAGNS